MNENHEVLCSSPHWAKYLHEELLPSLTAGLGLGQRMLEIGPGPGAATQWLRHRVPELTALEADPGVAARLRAACAGTNVAVVHGDAAAMEFAGASFDAVGTFTMLHHVPTVALQDRVLAEAFRVLRPGGVLIGSDSLPSTELHDFHAGDIYNPVDPGSILARLRTVGFSQITVSAGQALTFIAYKAAPDGAAAGQAAACAGRAEPGSGGRVMTGVPELRSAIVGLVGFASLEEELLVAAGLAADEEPGRPQCWAARPLLAHNAEFKSQQAQRLVAVRSAAVPPVFTEIDHRSPDVYRRYASQPVSEVVRLSRAATVALLDGLAAISDDDLLDPGRNPWLEGRQLWLQIIVRGFWHPTGHLGEYYLGHGQPDRAVALQAHAAATADYLRAPAPARGMARYNLACAQARSGRAEAALAQLRQAVELNPALRANVSRDADLADLRDAGQLSGLLGS